MIPRKTKQQVLLFFVATVVTIATTDLCDADFDLVFVVDSSGSIRDTNPEGEAENGPRDNYNLLKSFMSRIVEELEISFSPLTGVKVGIVTFGNRGKVELQLTGNRSVVNDKINSLPYQGGATNTSGGLWKAESVVLANEMTNRLDVEDVILVITDGVATLDVNRTVPFAEGLQNNGVRMFAVGITEAAAEDEVRELASPNNDGERLKDEAYWLLPSFDALDEVVISMTGVICSILNDLCTPQPCLHDGACISQSNSFTCNCSQGFYGNICQNEYCDPSPCGANGECVPRVGGYSCNCLNGYAGYNCEIDYCSPNPCLNGGQCERSSNAFTCACPVGYGGNLCQIDYCSANPCLNGGQCAGLENASICRCPDGYGGSVCQIDYCTPNPCLNSGECTREDGRYSCACASEYDGDHCQFLITTEVVSTSQSVVTQFIPVANESQSQDSGISGYLIALIVIIVLLALGVAIFIVTCCFWGKITALCRKPRERYVSPIKPLVIEKEEEVSTRSTQCNIAEKHPEPAKKTYEKEAVVVAKCPSCKNPYESCTCCPVCQRPDCDRRHHDTHHLNVCSAHARCHVCEPAHVYLGHCDLVCDVQGCAECASYECISGYSSSGIGSVASSGHSSTRLAMRTYNEDSAGRTRRKRRTKRQPQHHRRSRPADPMAPETTNDTASVSSGATLVSRGAQGFTNHGYGYNPDVVYIPSEGGAARSSTATLVSHYSYKSRVSAGK